VEGLVVEAVAKEPGERSLSILGEGPVVVDPSARLEVVLRRRLPDARLVLLDGADALVPARGERELAQGTTLTLAPAERLAPGRSYVLLLDGAATREVHDEEGNAFTPMTLSLTAAGSPEEAPRKPRPPVRHRRKR
jgi:hypothetical protein